MPHVVMMRRNGVAIACSNISRSAEPCAQIIAKSCCRATPSRDGFCRENGARKSIRTAKVRRSTPLPQCRLYRPMNRSIIPLICAWRSVSSGASNRDAPPCSIREIDRARKPRAFSGLGAALYLLTSCRRPCLNPVFYLVLRERPFALNEERMRF